MLHRDENERVFDTVNGLMDDFNAWLSDRGIKEFDREFGYKLGELVHSSNNYIHLYSKLEHYASIEDDEDTGIYYRMEYMKNGPSLELRAQDWRNHDNIRFKWFNTRISPNKIPPSDVVHDLGKFASTEEIEKAMSDELRVLFEEFNVPNIDRILKCYVPALVDIHLHGSHINTSLTMDGNEKNETITIEMDRLNWPVADNACFPKFTIRKLYKFGECGLEALSQTHIMVFDKKSL